MKIERPMTSEEYQLVRNNIGLAKHLYQIYYARFQKRADYGIDPDDLISHAYYGLVRAAMRYRAYGEERGYSEESIASGQYFSVFARKSIIGQMLDSLRKMDHVHTLVRKDYKTLVEHGLGAENVEHEDIAKSAEISVDRMKKVIHLVQSRPVYLDDTLDSEEEVTVGETIASEAGSVEDTARERALRQTLYDAFIELDKLERVVIAMKYYGERELPEIAEITGRSLTEIRRAHTSALLNLVSAWVTEIEDH